MEEEIREKAYRFYITESLKFIAENTARAVKDGKYLEKSFKDLPFFSRNNKSPEQELQENQKKAEEIIIGFYNKIKEYEK